MAVSELSKKIRKGNIGAIMDGFLSGIPAYEAQAVIGAVNNHAINDEIINQLFRLRSDKTIVFGYSLADFATAALDKFEIERYKGDDPVVRILIKNDNWWG